VSNEHGSFIMMG